MPVDKTFPVTDINTQPEAINQNTNADVKNDN